MEASLQNWVNERTLLPNNSPFLKRLMEKFFQPIGLERRAREMIANSICKELETSKDSSVNLPYLNNTCNTLENLFKKDTVLKTKSKDTVTHQEITKEVAIEAENGDTRFIAREIDSNGDVISEAHITKKTNEKIEGNRLIINSGGLHINSTSLPLSTGKVFAFIYKSIVSSKR